jgi:hypothetical protein
VIELTAVCICQLGAMTKLKGTLSALLISCSQGAVPGKPAPIVATPSTSARVPERAFPGALGWAATPGGRGGRVIRVTTLGPSGPGSIAAALEEPGPRIVVFEVGGVIDLSGQNLEIREPFLTLAGQTAPSPGITLIKGGLKIQTHDVILQHLRVRPGEAGHQKRDGWEVDGISTSRARDVIVDHCSTSWATDENLSASGPRFEGPTPDDWRKATSHRITFSHNIVAEGLSNSTHRKGEHSKGTLIHDNVTEVLIFGSLYHSNVERNPFFKGGARGVVVNNLITNPAKYAVKYTLVADEWGDHPHQRGQMAVVGNVFRYGPDTPPDTPLLYSTGPGACELFAFDNLARHADRDVALFGGEVRNFVTVERPSLWPADLAALPASSVESYVLEHAGARPWDRDATDLRIVREARNQSGKVIDSEREVGDYPVPEATRAPFIEAEWNLVTMHRR